MKVNIFSLEVRRTFTKAIAIASAIATFFFIAIDVSDDARVPVLIVAAAMMVTLYIAIWVVAKFRNSRKLHINNSVLEIKTGDLFEQEGFKVVAFNEYFDTQVDDKIISKNSLNGVYLSRKTKEETAELDKNIKSDANLANMAIDTNKRRRTGKKQRYKLGSIHVDGEYLLVAFSKFNKQNMAYLYLKDYINCLITFWEEIDRVYAGRSVSLPLLGSGITRLKDASLQPQENLNILIWTFKISKVKFKYPSKATIVIHDSMKDKINLSSLDT